MVAEFPNFSKVTLEDKQSFDEFNAQFPPYADWAFGTLMTWWDAFDDLEASRLSGNVVIRSSYLSMGKTPQFTLLGDQHIDETVKTLFAYQRQQGLPQELYSLPQYTVDALNNSQNYLVVHDPHASEYIISSEENIHLEGKRLYHIRRAVQSFEQAMADRTVDVTTIPLNTFPAKLMLINALHTWQKTIYKNDIERLEGAVIDRAFMLAEHIGLKCLCLFIDKEPEAFVLYKHLPHQHINISHIKSSYKRPSLFRYMTHVMTAHFHEHGFLHINWEQDLGIEGLRHFKESLRPIGSLKKYNLYLKEAPLESPLS